MFKVILGVDEIKVESKYVMYVDGTYEGNYIFYNEENKDDMGAPVAVIPSREVRRIIKN